MKQNYFKARWHRSVWMLTAALAFTLTSTKVQAAPFELIYSGSFNTQNALNLASQSSPTYFTELTPFTIHALFDTSSPNLAPPSPPAPPPFAGFRAYSPSLVTIDIGNQTYTMENFDTNPTAGVTVAIFDRSSFTPGRYAIGILQQPPQDGAGIIGDFSGASPDFTANALTSTTFTGYNGVGYGSGVCLQGTGGDCQVNAVTPFVLHGSGNQTWALTLGNYDEIYPGGSDVGMEGPVGPLNQAQLIAIPEPGTLGVVGMALAAVFGFARRRRNR
ncbi:MAG: PEP-CTERM sorting domain-containing protein [Acidobacteriaceae bacterium]|nr:PEP-CTERM sorting domain-containing protein [Acidobacteriaceae bacterium]